MKINKYFPVKSSFLAIEKDLNIIVDKIMRNERLKKMLFYASPDCLSRKNLTEQETSSLFGKQIKIVPKFQIDSSVLTYLVITFKGFVQNQTNPEFRDSLIEFDIVCHYDQWHMQDFELRPFKIAAELDTMFNNQRLTGIGLLEFNSAETIILTEELAGVCLTYRAIHGGEDIFGQPNPDNEEKYKQEFQAMLGI